MAVQTPAQRAANKAFHDREEKRKGKRTSQKKKEQKTEVAKPRRAASKKNKAKSLSWGAILIIFAVIGGIFIEFLFLINARLFSA